MVSMSKVLLTIAAVAGAILTLAARAAEQKAKQRSAAPRAVVATIGDTAITESELEQLAEARLMALRSDEYRIRRQVLEEHVNRKLIEKEAKARGISVELLRKSEIDDKALPVTEDQKRAVYERSPSRHFIGKSKADVFAQIETNLKRIRISEAEEKFMNSLRQKTPVKILLDVPRLLIAGDQRPSLGPADAAVTIVEFSDFQCAACARASSTVKTLIQQYQGKVRLVFRNFPLSNHMYAQKAAEAAACAREQGKFWEMHDQMFTNQQRLAVPDLKAAAGELGINVQKFGSCLDSGKYASDAQNDKAAGQKYGISLTPTFLINGRLLRGAADYQTFVNIVEEELQRLGGKP